MRSLTQRHVHTHYARAMHGLDDAYLQACPLLPRTHTHTHTHTHTNTHTHTHTHAHARSKLHPDRGEDLLPPAAHRHAGLPPAVTLCGKMDLLDRLLTRLHATRHKVRVCVYVCVCVCVCVERAVTGACLLLLDC